MKISGKKFSEPGKNCSKKNLHWVSPIFAESKLQMRFFIKYAFSLQALKADAKIREMENICQPTEEKNKEQRWR